MCPALARRRFSSTTISSMESGAESLASLSAKEEPYSSRSSRRILCQMGSMAIVPDRSQANTIKYVLGHFFRFRKVAESTTIPWLELTRPLLLRRARCLLLFRQPI